MTQEKLLEGLKKDVRSLLVSAKGGLAPEHLKRDYLKMLGHPLPLVALGYRNVLDMVQDMPDVVALGSCSDGTVLLKAVGNDSTKGIEQLVAKQRSPKPKESARRGGMGPVYHRSPQQVPALPRRGQAPPAIPAQLRSQLRQLLSQGPVALSELETCFFKRFGRPLQAMHYGFYSFAEMLAAASDLVAIEQSRRGSLISLKSDMGSLNHAQRWTSTGLQQGLSVKPTQDSVAKDKFQPLSNRANGPLPQNESVPSVPPGDGKLHTMGSRFQTEPSQEERALENCIKKLEEQLRSQILECGAGDAVSPELKEKLRQVVAQSSDGILIHELPGEFKKLFGKDLPMAQCGFLSVTEMVGALSDTLYLKPGHGKEGNHWIITDIQDRPISPGRHKVKGSSTVEPAEDWNPSKINGSCCVESPWEEKHGDRKLSTEVMVEDTSLKVANKIIHQMVDVFPAMPLPPNGGGAVPLDALCDHKLYPTPRWQERALVAVLVERVVSPNHFYLRFDGTPETRALENLMMELRSCYTYPEVSERYRLPQSFVRPGQVCCVASRDVWFYRVVIHRVLNDSQVEVYYVDYGDLSTVDWRNLKLLKSCYSELPAQAVLSSLVGIQPVGGSWSKSTISYFQKLCCERPLVAVIHSYQEDILHVFLCDTHTEEDVYIHSALITEGHALPCPAFDKQHISSCRSPISMQFNPVSLYLATGLCDVRRLWDSPGGPSTNEGAQSTPGTQRTLPPQETCAVRAEEDISDLPDLEFINIADVTTTAQSLGDVILANPFGALLRKEPVHCEDAEPASGNGTPRDAEPASGNGTPRDAEPASGNGTPRDAEQASGNGTPRDADQASGNGPPRDTEQASGNGPPRDTEQASGNGPPRDAEPEVNENLGVQASLDTVGRQGAAPEFLGASRGGPTLAASPPPSPAGSPPTLPPAGESAQAGYYGGVAPSLPERTQNFLFSLFAPGNGVKSPRPCLRHVPPSFLGPAARLAAGAPFLDWHCHKVS